MDEDLKGRIAEDLRKSGFQSEMLAIEAFARREWQCEGSVGYRDRDQDVSRELDLLAKFRLIRTRPGGGSIWCSIQVAGEVKKAERPWVLLRERPLAHDELIDAWTNLTYSINLPSDQILLGEKLSAHSLLQRNGWKARGIHESFKPPSGASSSYGACVSVCKAAESALDAEETSSAPLRSGADDAIFFTLIKPLVVVDGLLVSAAIASDGSVEITEISSAVLRFQFRTAHYTRQNYTIDIVSLSELTAYLELSEQRVRHFLDALAEPPNISGGHP